MGVIFGLLYRRWGRVMPLIVAHSLIDAVTFVGYVVLVHKVSWLPRFTGRGHRALGRRGDSPARRQAESAWTRGCHCRSPRGLPAPRRHPQRSASPAEGRWA